MAVQCIAWISIVHTGFHPGGGGGSFPPNKKEGERGGGERERGEREGPEGERCGA